MRILILGCGSIGRRHALNARDLGAEVILCDLDAVRIKDFATENGFSKFYTDYNEAIENFRPKAAIISTPSNLHLSHAINIARQGIHILVEKPLSISLEGIDSLKDLIKISNITMMMAQSYRFHEGLLTLKHYIDKNEIGNIYHVEISGGWYLPDWHFREDYKKEYAAQYSLGGGVLLTSLSHTFDTIRWLFGNIIELEGWKAKLSDLDIDVEDYVSCLIKTDKQILINVTEDFLSRFPKNYLRLSGSDGYIFYNLREHTINIWNVSENRFLPAQAYKLNKSESTVRILEDGIMYDPTPRVIHFDFNNNNRYIEELKYFMKLVKEGKTKFDLDLSAGIRVLEQIFSPSIRQI